MGLILTLTQAGYTLGTLFLFPPGDRHDRRRLVLLKNAVLATLLFLCSLTGQLTSLLVASLLIGMAATMAQDIIPATAILAPAGKQGEMVDTVMTGLLLGILLLRTVSGVVGAILGWRVMYQTAAVSVALIGLMMRRVLPRSAIHSTLSYPQLMASMAHLWPHYPTSCRAALAQGVLSVAFSAFWLTLAVMLSEHYHMGGVVTGGFGIVDTTGAPAVPLAGGLADKFGIGRMTQMDAALITLSFVPMFMLPLLPLHGQLALIALSAIGSDLGLQSNLMAHQSLVYSLEPQARGYLNALLFTVVFTEMSLGSVLGNKLHVLVNWNGMVTLAVVNRTIVLAIRLLENTRLVAAERYTS